MSNVKTIHSSPPLDPRIEMGVPMPARKNAEGPVRSALRSLLSAPVGSSVFFPHERVKSKAKYFTVIKRLGGAPLLTLRVVTENGVEGVRIWKIAEPKQ